MPSVVEEGLAGRPLWQQLLGAFLRARAASTRRPAAPVASGVGGCVVRLVLIALVLLAILLIGLFVFGHALFQGLQPY